MNLKVVIKIKPKLKNPYGYKVCYKEKGSKLYVRIYITHTYKQAVYAKIQYIHHPPSNISKRKLKRLTWYIIPIKKSEIRAGIWREVPF